MILMVFGHLAQRHCATALLRFAQVTRWLSKRWLGCSRHDLDLRGYGPADPQKGGKIMGKSSEKVGKS